MGKHLPLHAVHAGLGAQFAERGGWEVPDRYGDPTEEYEAARHGLGMADLSCIGKVRLTGKDRVRFLNGMVTNDVKALAEGHGMWALMLTPKGRVAAGMRVFAWPDALLLETEPEMAEAVTRTLDRYVIADQVEVKDVGEKEGILSLYGPAAAGVVEAMAGASLTDWRPLEHRQTRIGDIPVRVVAPDEAGATGIEVWAPNDRLRQVWDAVWDAGRGAGVRPVGAAALEVLRIEAGIPRYGLDMDESYLALEPDFRQAISFVKGCYIGQEYVARIAHRGHLNRRRVGLRLAGHEAPPPGAKVSRDGAEVGRITSSAFSPGLQACVAMAYLRTGSDEPGTKVTVDVDGTPVEAEVVAMPFAPAAKG